MFLSKNVLRIKLKQDLILSKICWMRIVSMTSKKFICYPQIQISYMLA